MFVVDYSRRYRSPSIPLISCFVNPPTRGSGRPESVTATATTISFARGASAMRTLMSVLRPLVLPGIATSALYAFLFSWTEFLGALSFMTNDSLFTLPVALSNVETGTYGAVNYGLLLAGAVIAMIPCIVVYVALQRYYVRGLVSGALKG